MQEAMESMRRGQLGSTVLILIRRRTIQTGIDRYGRSSATRPMIRQLQEGQRHRRWIRPCSLKTMRRRQGLFRSEPNMQTRASGRPQMICYVPAHKGSGIRGWLPRPGASQQVPGSPRGSRRESTRPRA
eukprot:4591734-Pyramimonas_sp.AAC.1